MPFNKASGNHQSFVTYTKNISGENPADHGYDENGNSPPRRGLDNYFNNWVYNSGWTYFDSTIGSPYFTSAPISVIVGYNRFMAFNIVDL